MSESDTEGQRSDGPTVIVAVRLHGELQRRVPDNLLKLVVPRSTTVAEIAELLGLRSGEVWIATLGDQLVDKDQRIESDAELELIPPVAGGAQARASRHGRLA
jgi:molybdopterin converting factor small subunit